MLEVIVTAFLTTCTTLFIWLMVTTPKVRYKVRRSSRRNPAPSVDELEKLYGDKEEDD